MWCISRNRPRVKLIMATPRMDSSTPVTFLRLCATSGLQTQSSSHHMWLVHYSPSEGKANQSLGRQQQIENAKKSRAATNRHVTKLTRCPTSLLGGFWAHARPTSSSPSAAPCAPRSRSDKRRARSLWSSASAWVFLQSLERRRRWGEGPVQCSVLISLVHWRPVIWSRCCLLKIDHIGGLTIYAGNSPV